MAPKRGQSVEHTDEHEEFMKKLVKYHEERGTTLDLQPKVGIRHIDLFKLYQRVVGEGGYDLCSDTKAKPLMWRTFAEEFVGRNVYTAAQAFQIKNVYYKNLCAYEIRHHWDQEPPPKEILEEVTAKGGNVMTRTLENYVRPATREESQQNGDASDASPEQKTPKEEKTDPSDDPGSATGRSTRGLRQQPPQRVLFQPDLGSSRQSRTYSQPQTTHPNMTTSTSSNGVMSAISISNTASATLASFEPAPPYPLSLKPVITPANNPDFYRNERKRKLEANAGPLARKYRNIMLPGTGFVGPNIYVRAQLALQSGLLEEERYALHHLVKISHERGDKYRFDQFPGLAEALLKKVLKVTGLFYDVEWQVMYDDDAAMSESALNGLTGTPDILDKLKGRMSVFGDDSTLDLRDSEELNCIVEAGLIIRNMVMQRENSEYLSQVPLARDAMTVILSLPHNACTTELRHYMLDIAEQVLQDIDVTSQDDIYQCLLSEAMGSDRGATATALRTIARIAMKDPAPKRLDRIPLRLLHRVRDFLLIDDEEMRCACLDFLMQYTSFSDNVESLLRDLDGNALAKQLSRLLFAAAEEHREQRKPSQKEPETGTTPVPRLSKTLTEKLLKLDEPERSSEWLRMCFLPDPTTEMTQISLWQAYQGTFAPYQSTHPHLIAGDFIKNVSTTFPGATAQVAGSNKYVIKGIKSRRVPINTGVLEGSKATDKNKELCRCNWKITYPVDGGRNPTTGEPLPATTREGECSEWFANSDEMLHHILRNHLHVPTRSTSSPADGDKMDIDHDAVTPSTNGMTNGNTPHPRKETFDFSVSDKTTYKCRWADCKRTSQDFPSRNNVSRTKLFARHVETHLPTGDQRQHIRPDSTQSPIAGEILRITVLEDERSEAAGVPLRAALVLRNLARFMPKSLPAAARETKDEERPGGLMAGIFGEEVKERLFLALSHCKPLRNSVSSVLRAVKQGDEGPLQA